MNIQYGLHFTGLVENIKDRKPFTYKEKDYNSYQIWVSVMGGKQAITRNLEVGKKIEDEVVPGKTYSFPVKAEAGLNEETKEKYVYFKVFSKPVLLED